MAVRRHISIKKVRTVEYVVWQELYWFKTAEILPVISTVLVTDDNILNVWELHNICLSQPVLARVPFFFFCIKRRSIDLF